MSLPSSGQDSNWLVLKVHSGINVLKGLVVCGTAQWNNDRYWVWSFPVRIHIQILYLRNNCFRSNKSLVLFSVRSGVGFPSLWEVVGNRPWESNLGKRNGLHSTTFYSPYLTFNRFRPLVLYIISTICFLTKQFVYGNWLSVPQPVNLDLGYERCFLIKRSFSKRFHWPWVLS